MARGRRVVETMLHLIPIPPVLPARAFAQSAAVYTARDKPEDSSGRA